MEDQLKNWSQDKILSGMCKTMEEQREMINNEKFGVNSMINRQAFSLNLQNVYMHQISAPQFIGECYQNETSKAYMRRLKSMKDKLEINAKK